MGQTKLSPSDPVNEQNSFTTSDCTQVYPMEHHHELKERREANECATSEFHRVKQEKLRSELAKKSRFAEGSDEEKKKEREMANRASAAASRAKIVCYSKELEKRTDRLEIERNRAMLRADRAIKKLDTMRKEMRMLKKVLRDIWEMKEERTSSYLFESNVLHLLGRYETESHMTDPDEDIHPTKSVLVPLNMLSPRTVSTPQVGVPCYRGEPTLPALTPLMPSFQQPSRSPNYRSNVTDVRHLIHHTHARDRV